MTKKKKRKCKSFYSSEQFAIKVVRHDNLRQLQKEFNLDLEKFQVS